MIRDRVIQCLENIGYSGDYESDTKLSDFIEDSVQFVSFIVELEEEFHIEIPDDYLILGSFQDINDVCEIIYFIDKNLK